MDETTDDALEVIEQEAAAVGLALGAPPRMTEMLVDRIVQRLGGRLVYIAKRNREALDARNAAICREFNGKNLAELAKAHGITERQMRKILRACPISPRVSALAVA